MMAGTLLYASFDGSSIVTGTPGTLDQFTVTCGAKAQYPLTWWIKTTGGEYATQTVQPGQTVTHTFATALPFAQTTLKGTAVQQPPVQFFGVAQALTVTPPTATGTAV